MRRLAENNRSLDDFTYNDATIAGEIYSAMNATQFLGVSVLNSSFIFVYVLIIYFEFVGHSGFQLQR